MEPYPPFSAAPQSIRRAEAADAAAIAACVRAAYAPWVPRIGREPWPMLQDYVEVIATDSVYLYTNEAMVENIALYARVGYVEYERRQEEGFRRVFMRKQLARK